MLCGHENSTCGDPLCLTGRYPSRREPGQLVGKGTGLEIEKLRVRFPAEAAEEFSSPVSTLCADSYSVSVPSLCYRSGTLKTLVILPKVQVAGYTLTRTHP